MFSLEICVQMAMISVAAKTKKYGGGCSAETVISDDGVESPPGEVLDANGNEIKDV